MRGNHVRGGRGPSKILRPATPRGRFALLCAATVALVLGIAAPASASSVRAYIIWNNSNDVDLHAYDAVGNHAWFGDPDGIPDALLSSDITGDSGPEFFTDNQAPNTRLFRFEACLFIDYGHGVTDVSALITNTDGTQYSSAVTLTTQGQCVELGKPGKPKIKRSGKGKTRKRKISFRFRSTTPSARFHCRLLGKRVAKKQKRWRRCRSPKRYRRLRPGPKVFQVRAISPDGTIGKPRTRKWKIRK